MATTIQIKGETKKSLEKFKEKIGAKTYDDAISHLLKTSGGDSAFGSMKGWGSWTRKDRMEARTDRRNL